MRILDDALVLSPSDLSNFLSCRHRAGLDLAVANKQLVRPIYTDPYAAMLKQHGEDHERAYVESLRASGRTVVDLNDADDSARKTQDAMRAGVAVIVQARLEGDLIAGYADVLFRVEQPSDLGSWSYEVHDTKLAKETKGGTILQLSAYSDMVGRIQGRVPERFCVVSPAAAGEVPAGGSKDPPLRPEEDPPLRPEEDPPLRPEEDPPLRFAVNAFRVEDYAAYYRMVLAALRSEVAKGPEALISQYYPEPVEACALCVWEARCHGIRRKDDHLSFIANSGRSHRVELTAQGHGTLAAVAAMPVPVRFKPARGARETYDRLGHQARVQHQQRTEKKPIVERLPVQPGEGLCRLPPPSPGDLFLDLEGARFAREGGREFLFGIWIGNPKGLPPPTMGAGGSKDPPLLYRAWWAMNDGEERTAFEAVIDLIMAAWAADPGMHVYHFNHYEPTAFKKLMGRYVTRGEELDRLLRAERFVDLYPIARQSVRAGVESYSIKQLEQYFGYTRNVPLQTVRDPLIAVEIALDAAAPHAITPEIRDAVQGYNEDDCRSTEVLRDWLESIRAQCESDGASIRRPAPKEAEPNKKIAALQLRAEDIRRRLLLEQTPADAADPASPDHPRWLLAYLVDWHRREVNADWWEYYRLRDLPEDELFDEGDALGGLGFVHRVETLTDKKGKPTGKVIDRYGYPAQEMELHIGSSLKLMDETSFGAIVAFDRSARTIDVNKTKAAIDIHPSAVFSADVIGGDVQQEAVMSLAERLLASTEALDECGAQLLYRRPPRLMSGPFAMTTAESAQDFALRIVTALDRTTLAIQGPPGAGKTYIGAQMILALVKVGKRVGVTAQSHKVIRNLLDEVADQATRTNQAVRVGARVQDLQEAAGAIREFDKNETALDAIVGRDVDVLGGTSFLWSREKFAASVDVLFVDEAGQMSLANVLAVSQAAKSVVLLGDPQQLDQPAKASHPDGVGVSALEHMLGGAETMPPERGIFLPITWRMSPTLTRFTSELFYERKLASKAGLELQQLRGTDRYDGSNLWLVPVDHDGNQTSSMEEVEAVYQLVTELVAPGSKWICDDATERKLMAADLRVVAPFNAQVNRLTERLLGRGVSVGTVDKFQGQTCAVVIYSMTTSRPEDAPRGMEFLYSLNRLNVATSRARCAVFLVASPRLFEPDCRTPRQMQLANALCRYREMAQDLTGVQEVRRDGDGVRPKIVSG